MTTKILNPKQYAEESSFEQFEQFEKDRPARFEQFVDYIGNWTDGVEKRLGCSRFDLRYYVIKIPGKRNDVRVWVKPPLAFTLSLEGRALLNFANHTGVRPDWHEPDEQEVTAKIVGESFDNAGGSGEMEIILAVGDNTSVCLNLASVLALATAYAREHLVES